jgi:hypothetical protein
VSGDAERAIRWVNGTANGPALVREVSAEDLCMDTLLMALSRAGLDRIDAAISDYHATRVPDPHEALWRTDYTRVHMRRELAEDRPWPDHPDAVYLRGFADEIEQRWTTDAAVAPHLAELDNLRATAEYRLPLPQAEKLPTMPGEAPPGMDPVTWRSQLQARDLTSHGRWPDITTTTTTREDTEPMNDTTRNQDRDNPSEPGYQSRYPGLPPAYDDPSLAPMLPYEAHDFLIDHGYTNEYATHMTEQLTAAGLELTGDNIRGWIHRPENMVALQEQAGTGSWTEQQMRADFMHAQSCVSHDPEDYDPADHVDYDSYASRWMNGDETWMNEWIYLQSATVDWRTDPAAAETALRAVRDGELTPIQARSQEQAGYIAEHGIERDEHGFLTSHYVTRVEERSGSATDTRSPLADYRPGNAVAAHLANPERDGVDR